MGKNTKIEWADETWNPLTGCTPVSEGCRNCYAARMAVRLGANPQVQGYEGTAEMRGSGDNRRAVFTGLVNLLPDRLEQPLGWRKPRRVFVNSMSDLFHPSVPFEFVDQVWAVMALCPQHIFQVLTKRPRRMAEYLSQGRGHDVLRTVPPAHRSELGRIVNVGWPLPNVWLGTSVEHQNAADERVSHLLRCPAAVRFLSCEPLLGPVSLDDDDRGWLREWHVEPDSNGEAVLVQNGRVDWVIVGGESGPNARPCDVQWIRSLLEQCLEYDVPVFVKQLGARPHDGERLGRPLILNDPKAGQPHEWPPDLRVRELPVTGGGHHG